MTRQELRQAGEAMRSRLFGDAPLPAATERANTAPGYRALMSEAVYGAVWSRPGLTLDARMLCTLAALSAVQRIPHLRQHVGAALDLGLEPTAILEIFLQAGLYAGFPTTEASMAEAMDVFAERGVSLPAQEPRDDSLEALSARGQELMQWLHGSRGTQGYASPENKVTGAMYPLAIQYGYGELWFRPGLDRRQRALCAVAAFTALRLESQVRKFGESALNAGLSREEIIEAVIQTAPFSGFPPALNALAALSDVLK